MPVSRMNSLPHIGTSDYAETMVSRIKHTSESERFYLLEVDESHTYYIGKAGLWVHDASPFFPSVADTIPERFWADQELVTRGAKHLAIVHTEKTTTEDDADYYATSLTNISDKAVRVRKYAGFVQSDDGYRLNTTTGEWFSARDFMRDYRTQPSGWISPGETVADGSNFGYAVNGFWVFWCENEDGEYFPAIANLPTYFDIYRPLAEAGNADALCKVGSAYFRGQFVEKDIERGLAFWREAAEKGNANAQAYLGSQYLIGTHIPQDYTSALKYLLLAGAQDQPDALNNLAYMYENGIVVKKDQRKAMDFLKKAAVVGDVNAHFALGTRYRFGEFIEKDLKKAYEHYRAAAEQGYHFAQCNLADMYEKGDGIEQHFPTALHWYGKSAEQGNMWAQYSLGMMYKLGQGVIANIDVARAWFEKAAVQGYDEAKKELASM